MSDKINLMKEKAEQAAKDKNRQENVGWFQVFFGACAVVGGIVACCCGLPIVGTFIIAGGMAFAGTAHITANAMGNSGNTKK